MMRKPIFAGVLGAVGAIIVIVGLLIFEIWPFQDSSSPQDSPIQVLDTENSPNRQRDGTIVSAPEDILDVNLTIGDSVIPEVTRNGVAKGDTESQDPEASSTVTEPPENAAPPPPSGPKESASVDVKVDFEVRDADGNLKQSGSAK